MKGHAYLLTSLGNTRELVRRDGSRMRVHQCTLALGADTHSPYAALVHGPHADARSPFGTHTGLTLRPSSLAAERSLAFRPVVLHSSAKEAWKKQPSGAWSQHIHQPARSSGVRAEETVNPVRPNSHMWRIPS